MGTVKHANQCVCDSAGASHPAFDSSGADLIDDAACHTALAELHASLEVIAKRGERGQTFVAGANVRPFSALASADEIREEVLRLRRYALAHAQAACPHMVTASSAPPAPLAAGGIALATHT